jgi:hypothetical protein
MDQHQHGRMKPNWRKPVGTLLILLYICMWAGLVTSQADWIGRLPWPLQALVYCVAGIIWIAPLKPALRWMELGRWRA